MLKISNQKLLFIILVNLTVLFFSALPSFAISSHRNFKNMKFRFPAVFLQKQSAGDKIGTNSDPFDFAQGRPEHQSKDDVTPVFALRSKATGPEGKIVHERKRVPILESKTSSQGSQTLQNSNLPDPDSGICLSDTSRASDLIKRAMNLEGIAMINHIKIEAGVVKILAEAK